MLKRVVACMAVVALMLTVGASAQSGSGYPPTDPKDKIIPATAAAPLDIWKEMPVWQALSDCAAWHSLVKNADTTKQPDAEAVNFFLALTGRLQADRGMDPVESNKFAMHWMKVAGGLKVSAMRFSKDDKELDTACGAVLKYNQSLK